jgi:hypothetical protein
VLTYAVAGREYGICERGVIDARMNITALALLLVSSSCARYTTRTVEGPRSEVSRQLIGSPQIEERTSAGLDAGFAGTSSGRSTIAGLSGNYSNVKRTHCVQQAQVEYEMPIDSTPDVEHRAYDVIGGILTGLVGLGTISSASASYDSDREFHMIDPQFFSEPESPTGAYAVGGLLVAGAAAWLGWTAFGSPRGEKPASARTMRRWTEVQYVEATGCGLVPADR